MPKKLGRPIKVEQIEKVCTICKILKSINNFKIEPTLPNPNRRRNQCADCRRKQINDRRKKTQYHKRRYASMGEEEKKQYIKKKSQQNQRRFKTNPEALKRRREYGKTDSGIYCRYKGDCNRRNRKRRNIKMQLTLEEFSAIINSPCVYCGLLSRGVDRVDSDGNYTVENSVPCCKKCNQMKNNMNVNEFTEHIILIVNHCNLISKKGKK